MTSVWRCFGWSVALGLLGFAAASCATTTGVPVTYCGHSLDSALGPVHPIYPAYAPGVGVRLPVGATFSVAVSSDCTHGSSVSVEPAGLVRIEKQVLAPDNRVIAMRLVGLRAGSGAVVLGPALPAWTFQIVKP